MAAQKNSSHWINFISDDDRDKLRFDLLASHKAFCRAFFDELEDVQLEDLQYVDLLCDLADGIIFGKGKSPYKQCWMPPGYGKTMILTIMLIARGFAVNPNARIMHISYSDDLVKDNSSKVRDIIQSELFQALWPMSFREDTNAKGLWRLSEGGELKAVSTAGQITGFRAGRLGEGYTGHMSIDDPMKPLDAASETTRKKINKLFKSTVPSRLMHVSVPVLLVMQRLDIDDTAAFFARGGFRGFTFEVLSIPANNDGHAPEIPDDYTHCIKINYTISKGALWPQKESEQDLLKIRDSQIDGVAGDEQGDYYYHAQYQQNPKSTGDSFLDRDWINWYKEPPELLENGFIRIDTASSDSAKADFTACTTWASDKRFENQLFAIDGMRIKAKPMQMFKAVADYVEKCIKATGVRYQINVVRVENANIGPALSSYLEGEMPLRNIQVRVELLKGEVRKFNKKTDKIEVVAKNKFQRAEFTAPWIQQGRLWLPSSPNKYSDAQFASVLESEIVGFTLDDRHANDDYFDTAVLALIDQFHKEVKGFSYSGMSSV